MTIYTDNAATTKMSDTALAAMLPCLQDNYGNPSSLHSVGQRAAEALQGARETVARCLGCDPKEIIFTSGGSEADNQAIISAARWGALKGKKHIISTAFEHHAVLHTLKKLEKEGFEVELLPVGTTGTITPEQVAAAIRPDTALVTIMYANNEIGSILPIAEIGAVCREKGVIFHTDAVQAAGHLHIDVKAQNIDMLSLSGHKFHGPKGSGVLYARKGIPLVNIIEGGAQERGKRAGTENLPAIVGMAAALQEACDHIDENAAKVSALRDKLISGLSKIPHSALNGDPVHRLPGNVNFCFEGIEGESLLLLLDAKGICASSGSACTSGSLDPSHVLLAIGRPHEVAHGSLRLSLCEWNTEEEVDIILREVEDRGVPAQYEPHVEGPGQRQEAVHAVIRRQISWHCIPTL
jgi:cysteine desulfurase